MVNKTAISVVIPVYNRTDVLVRAVNSVLAQSYAPLEIIIVDDCSEVNIKNYLKPHKLVRVVRNKTNLGVAESRNVGVGLSKGKYVAFLDSDDYWHKDKLKVFAREISIKEADLLYSDEYIVKSGNKFVPSNKKIIDNNVWNELLNGWTAPNTSTLIVKKKSFLKAGGFNPEFRASEDHDLWMNFASRNYIIRGLKQKLVFFTHTECDRLSFNLDIRLSSVKKFCNKWVPIIKKKNGLKKAEKFRKENINKVVFPIFIIAIKKMHLMYASKIYFRYIVFNKYFYILLFNILLKKMRLKKNE